MATASQQDDRRFRRAVTALALMAVVGYIVVISPLIRTCVFKVVDLLTGGDSGENCAVIRNA